MLRVSIHKTISYNYFRKAEIFFLAERSEFRWGRENITEQEPESTNVSSFVYESEPNFQQTGVRAGEGHGGELDTPPEGIAGI